MPEPRCNRCAREHYRTWTPDRVIERIQAWSVIYGEPPATADWNPWQARNAYHDEDRARRYEAGRWPTVNTVIRFFCTWNAALQAAGFEARAPHGGNGNELRRRDHRQQVPA